VKFKIQSISLYAPQTLKENIESRRHAQASCWALATPPASNAVTITGYHHTDLTEM